MANSINKKDKILFLHIPKTAGTSVNLMLSKGFQTNRIKLHAESERSSRYKDINWQNFDFISGHLLLRELTTLIPAHNNVLKITILRNPIQQLLSHINWVKYISNDTNSKFFKNHPDDIKDFSLKLREINFNKANEVIFFLENMPDIGHRLFNNCQTRYLMDKASIRISAADAQKAIDSLSFFDYVGTLENLENFIQKIYFEMNWSVKTKVIKSNALKNKYKVNIDSKKIEEALYPLYCADQILYEHISQQPLF